MNGTNKSQPLRQMVRMGILTQSAWTLLVFIAKKIKQIKEENKKKQSGCPEQSRRT